MIQKIGNAREPLIKWKVCTVDLLVQISLPQLILILKISFTYFTKQATLMRRSNVLSLLLRLLFPGRALLRVAVT